MLHGLRVGGAEVLAARLARQLAGHARFLFACLDELADAAVRRGKAGWAAQLWGAGARQREAADLHKRPIEPVERAQLVESARETLGPRAFQAAWEEGRPGRMSLHARVLSDGR